MPDKDKSETKEVKEKVAEAKNEPAEKPAKDKSQDSFRERVAHIKEDRYYTELMRVGAWLFVGVLATMTFLLTVGLQRPKGLFQYALYSAIVVLPLNLLAYVFGHVFAEQVLNGDLEGKKLAAARRRLAIMRMVQQTLFVLAVVATAWLAYSAAQFFFNLPAANPMGGGAPPQ